MWPWLANLVMVFTGLSAAASFSESIQKGKRRRIEERRLNRGMILPDEAAKELAHRLGGRVAVGKDLEGPLLVVIRTRSPVIPGTFAGYRVRHQPHL